MYNPVPEVIDIIVMLISMSIGFLFGSMLHTNSIDQAYDKGWCDGIDDAIRAMNDMRDALEELEIKE
jgi:hypothetical protein